MPPGRPKAKGAPLGGSKPQAQRGGIFHRGMRRDKILFFKWGTLGLTLAAVFRRVPSAAVPRPYGRA